MTLIVLQEKKHATYDLNLQKKTPCSKVNLDNVDYAYYHFSEFNQLLL